MAQTHSDILSAMLNFGISERGNHSFRDPDTGNAVLFAKVSDHHHLQCSYSQENYPKWNCSVIEFSDDELKAHIKTNLPGWYVDKCSFDDIQIDKEDRVSVQDNQE